MNEAECLTCGATYGAPVDGRPERCGVCITGLSLDGRPVRPVRGDDGVMRCGLCLGIGASCELVPHDKWEGAWRHALPFTFAGGSTGRD